MSRPLLFLSLISVKTISFQIGVLDTNFTGSAKQKKKKGTRELVLPFGQKLESSFSNVTDLVTGLWV